MMASSLPSVPAGAASSGSNAHRYEETHVHQVYEAIAPHFSATRHKPWPFVSSFLAAQPPGAVGLDVGCGNGKNMGVNHNVVILGCDRSAALVALARDTWCCSSTTTTSKRDALAAPPAGQVVIAGADVAVADGLVLPFREGSADFVICIAVIHHLSTKARRVDAIRQLLRCIRRRSDPVEKQHQQGGQVLVYVWALEQSSSRRGWGEGGEQDLLVPWVMKAPQEKKKKQQQQQQGHNKKTTNKKNTVSATTGPAVTATSHGTDSKDALAAPSHAAADAAAVAKTDEGGTITAAANVMNNNNSSSGEGGEGGRDAVAMQGHRQESHKDNLVVDRSRDGSRETTAEIFLTDTTAAAAAEDKEAVVSDAGAENTFAAVEDNAKRANDGQQQQQGQGQGQGPREKQQQQRQHADADKTFHRFYHLYKKGELEQDVAAAGGKVLSSGYERDNWWVIAG